jgi:hypothetical protein
VTLAGIAEFVLDDCAKTGEIKNKGAMAQAAHLKALNLVIVKLLVLIWP